MWKVLISGSLYSRKLAIAMETRIGWNKTQWSNKRPLDTHTPHEASQIVGVEVSGVVEAIVEWLKCKKVSSTGTSGWTLRTLGFHRIPGRREKTAQLQTLRDRSEEAITTQRARSAWSPAFFSEGSRTLMLCMPHHSHDKDFKHCWKLEQLLLVKYCWNV